MKQIAVKTGQHQFRKILAESTAKNVEIIFTRRGKPVARLIPELPEQNALKVFGDLAG